MNTQDALNIILIIGFLIITVCIVLTTYFLVQVLKSIANLANSLQNTSQSIREKLQLRVLTAIPALLITLFGKMLRRGR